MVYLKSVSIAVYLTINNILNCLMNNSWKEWFSFTKKERTGIIVLVILIIGTTCLPWFFSAYFIYPDKQLTKELHEEILRLQKNIDTSGLTRTSIGREMPQYDLPVAKKTIALFEFDPNTLSVEGWRKLGLRERAIQVIQKYLIRGGKFRQPADLKRIYGLPEEQAAQLIPYVRIHMPEPKYKKEEYKKREPIVVDINTADTTAFIALPGIGSKLARRIISFREKLGGFYSVEQIKETYGLADSTFQQIKPLLKNSATVQKIDINTADANELGRHPYIGRNLANAIVKFREQHGAYKAIEDLQKIVLITPGIFEKIVHYVAVK